MQIPAHPIEDLTELADPFILDPGAVKVLTQALCDLKGAVDDLDDLSLIHISLASSGRR